MKQESRGLRIWAATTALRTATFGARVHLAWHLASKSMSADVCETLDFPNTAFRREVAGNKHDSVTI